MELAFESRELRSICEHEFEARHALGQSVAQLLKHRLADLIAADSLQDLLAGSPRVLEADSGPQLIIELADGYQMCLVPNHPGSSLDSSDIHEWTSTRRLKIISISKE